MRAVSHDEYRGPRLRKCQPSQLLWPAEWVSGQWEPTPATWASCVRTMGQNKVIYLCACLCQVQQLAGLFYKGGK